MSAHNEYARMPGNPFRKRFGQIVSLTGIDVWHWQRRHLVVNETRQIGGPWGELKDYGNGVWWGGASLLPGTTYAAQGIRPLGIAGSLKSF